MKISISFQRLNKTMFTNGNTTERRVKFHVQNWIKKPKLKNATSAIYKCYSPKHFKIKPTQNLLLNLRIAIKLSDEIRSTFGTLLTVQSWSELKFGRILARKKIFVLWFDKRNTSNKLQMLKLMNHDISIVGVILHF